MMGFPNSKEIKKIIGELSEIDPSLILSENTTKVELLKYSLCKEFVIYIKEKGIKQKDLAVTLQVDPARVSWIVKYHIHHFTVDRLYELLSMIRPNLVLRIG